MQDSSAAIRTLVDQFVESLTALASAAARERVQAAVAAALGHGGVLTSKRALPAARRPVGRPPGRPAGRQAPRATAKLALARKLQGQYLGALRALRGADRDRVKKLASDEGVAEAVALAKKLAAR